MKRGKQRPRSAVPIMVYGTIPLPQFKLQGWCQPRLETQIVDLLMQRLI